MIEQERRDRELALRLAQGPEALDAEAEQAPQLPLQRFGYEHKILWGPLNWRTRTRTRTTIRVRVSVLSMRIKVWRPTFSKCACSERKTRSRSRPRSLI